MRFSFVPVALLALSPSLLPSVYAVPAIASHDAHSLVVRQASLVDGLVTTIQGIVQGLVDQPLSIQEVQQITQELQDLLRPVNSLLRRADLSTIASSSTSHVLAASTTRTSTSIVATTPNVSLSTPRVSPTPPTRMSRQLPLSLLSSILGSLTAAQPVASLPASVLSVAVSKLGSVTSGAAQSKPSTGNH